MKGLALLRGTLWVTAAFNLFAAALLANPQLGERLVGLPPPASNFHAWMLAAFVGVFGFVYSWMARAPQISRPLLAVACFGKFAAFAVTTICLLRQEIPLSAAAPGFADFAFAVVFLRALVSGQGA